MDFFVSHTTLTSHLPEFGSPSPIDADNGNNGVGDTLPCIVALFFIIVAGYWLNANLMTFRRRGSSCLVPFPSFSSLRTAHAFLTRLPRDIYLPRVPYLPCRG
jgi:hypothetical protein